MDIEQLKDTFYYNKGKIAIVVAIIIVALLLFVILTSIDTSTKYDVEITVVNQIGIPIEGAKLGYYSDCEEDFLEAETDKEGKADVVNCLPELDLTVDKAGYVSYSDLFDIDDPKKVIHLSPVPIVERKVTVFVKDEMNIILQGAELSLLCDGNLVKKENQTNQGVTFTISQSCSATQVKASLAGYEQKTQTINSTTERYTINLTRIISKGKVAFHSSNREGGEGNTTISVTDELGRMYPFTTDSSGEKLQEIQTGEYSYSAISNSGALLNGTFEILTNSTTDVNLFFDYAPSQIVQSTIKEINLQVVDTNNNSLLAARVMIYQNNNYTDQQITDTNGKIKRNINTALIPDNTTFFGFVFATGYEAKGFPIQLLPKDSEPQKVILSQGGSTLKIKTVDDTNTVIAGATIVITQQDWNILLGTDTTDINGKTTFVNLPAGNYKIVADKTSIYAEEEIELAQDETVELTLTMLTGKGNISYKTYDQKKDKANVSYKFFEEIDGSMQKVSEGTTSNGAYSASNITVYTPTNLVVDDGNYFYHESIISTISRGLQTREVFVRKLTDLPNDITVQMFLLEVYDNNPLYGTPHPVTKILPGKDYYIYFDTILNNEETDFVLENVYLDSNSYDTGLYSLEDAYSIDGYSRVMTNNKQANIIETQLNTNLVDENAEQINVTLQEQSGPKSIPTILKFTVDQNAPAEGKFTINFSAMHGTTQSLAYSYDFFVGETFCLLTRNNCPAFLYSNYITWGTHATQPITDETYVLIGDPYQLSTKVKNLTDISFGEIILKSLVPTDRQDYLKIADTNSISQSINLGPLATSLEKSASITPIKATGAGKVKQELQKMVDGLNSLDDYESYDNIVTFAIKNKETVVVGSTPLKVYKNSTYPFFVINTKYMSGYKGIPANWYMKLNGDILPSTLNSTYSGKTDVNGIQVISLDATTFNTGDILTIVAEDENGSIPGEFNITIQDPFPITNPIVYDCTKIKLNGMDINGVDNPYVSISKNASTSLTIDLANCSSQATYYLYTDLYVSEKQFTIKAGDSKTVSITGQIRDNILGAYPVQILKISGANYSSLGTVDVVVTNSGGSFSLSNAIFDFRTELTNSAVMHNSSFSGRKDNFYPKADLSTNHVSMAYNKPGTPSTYTFTASVTGHAIESIVYGFVKSDTMKVDEACGEDNDPLNIVQAAPSEAQDTTNATDLCEDLVYEGEYTEKPEPDLTVEAGVDTNTYTPTSVVPISGNTTSLGITTTTASTAPQQKEKRISFEIASAAGSTGSALTGSLPSAYETTTCTSPNNNHGESTQAPNCGPYHNGGYNMQYVWYVLSDIYGVATPGAPRPPDATGEWGGVRELNAQTWKVMASNPSPNAGLIHYTYAGGGYMFMEYNVKGHEYHVGVVRHCRTSSITTQVDFTRVLEWFAEQVKTWSAEVTIEPIEGHVYDVGSYSDAKPVPQWSLEDTAFGIEEGETFVPSGSRSLYTVACITPNNFVDPERTASAEADEAWEIKDQTDPYIEYDGTGTIMYEIEPGSVPSDLDVYLRDGHYYAEYVGVPEISSPNISITLTKNNLQGTEYAILKVQDWTGSSVNEQAFQVKLIGPQTDCYTKTGRAGITGTELVPKLLFNWDWNSIAYNQCDTENSSGNYCDGVQFNISLMKRLSKINNYMLVSNLTGIANETAFYAYLIKDNYSTALLNDFKNYYEASLFEASSEFDDFKSFIEGNKISFVVNDSTGGTLLPYGGIYRVEIAITKINAGLNSLIDIDQPNATIVVKLTPVQQGQNYNPFYETPFDGAIGTNRSGYGTGINQQLKLNPNITLPTGNASALKQVNYSESNNLSTLNNEIILSYNSNGTMEFNPSQPTPVTATITGTGTTSMKYIVDGTGSTDMPAKIWNMTNSTIGGSSCHDFTDQQKTVFSEIVSGTTHRYNWSGNKSGTVTLKTTFFTPKNLASTSRLTPDNSNTTLGSYSYLINSQTVMLNNYDAQGITDYDTLQGTFDLIQEEKLCITNDSTTDTQIFWNPEYIQEIEDELPGTGSSCS